MLKLTYMQLNDWHMPAYKDQDGKVWLDINLGDGEPDLHSSSNNDIDGEPDYRIRVTYEFISKYEKSLYHFTYMMLSRLQSDCDYYLGHGNRNENHINGENGSGTINQMKDLWNSLPLDEKPEWLSMEDILEYEQEMANPSGRFNDPYDWWEYKQSKHKASTH